MSEIVYKNIDASTLVLYPPISEYIPDMETVSKILTDDVKFNHERQIAYYMRKNIPATGDFAIQPIKYNYIKAASILNHIKMTPEEFNELISGKLDPELDDTIIEIIYRYGGVSMDKYNPLYKIRPNSFLMAWRPLFYGLEKMHGFMCHNDIKPGNIVYNTEENWMRFIDFGSAMILKKNDNYRDTIYHAIGNYNSVQFYEYWSPEIAILMNYKCNHMSPKALAEISNYYTNYMSAYYKICQHLLKRPELIEKAQRDFTELANYIHNSKDNPFKNKENTFIMDIYNQKFYKEHIRNIDIYSLGITMGITLYRLKGSVRIDSSHPICNLIAKMITVDYRSRISPKEALVLFDDAVSPLAVSPPSHENQA